MIHLKTHTFYEEATGKKHEISISFGGISPVSNGHYEVIVDGQTYSTDKSANMALYSMFEIIERNNWIPVDQKAGEPK